MNEKSISSTSTLTFKYGWYAALAIVVLLSILILEKEFKIYNLLLILIAVFLLALVTYNVRTLKEVSFNEHELIIRDLNSINRVDLSKIKRIYRIDVGMFYRIEFTNDRTVEYVDIWPSINLIEMWNGQLPKNFDELLSLIEK